MKQTLQLVLVLTVICVAAGLSLAVINNLTSDRIAAVAEMRKQDAIASVLPDTGETPEAVDVIDSETGATNTFYVVRKDGRVIGAAIAAMSPNGYGGDIKIMVGFNNYGEIQTIKVLEHKETPGLGAKIATVDFETSYAGLRLGTTTWSVTKDGGDLDTITAATISSRAVAEAVAEAVAKYDHAQAMLRQEEEPLKLEDIEIPDELR